MAKFLVGLGLVVMISAVAYLGIVYDDPSAATEAVNSAITTAAWLFVAGVGVAIFGGLRAAR